MVFPPKYMGKEGIIPCGQNEQLSKAIRRVGDGDKMGWTMAFQHDKELMHLKAPSSTTVWKMFQVKFFVV
jgi:hypothetical protein